MKSSSKILYGLVAAALGSWVLSACTNRMPTSRSYPAHPPDYTTVINFDDGTAFTNPTLFNSIPGGQAVTLGGVSGLGTITTISAPPAGDSTPFAAHMLDVFTDLGNGVYPSSQFRIHFTASGYYNLSYFSGIKFMYNVTPPNASQGILGDDSLVRRFGFAVAQTVPFGDPDGGGTCDNSNNGCYNNFGAMLDNTNGAWVTKSYNFTDLTRENFGNSVSPPTFSGVNLQQVIRLVFEFKRNNSAGTDHVDYWVDNIELF